MKEYIYVKRHTQGEKKEMKNIAFRLKLNKKYFIFKKYIKD